jgi:predicted transcriptional regulator
VTRLLEAAVEKVRAMPDAEQDALARVLLDLVGVEQPPVALTPEEEADLAEALAEADRGEFASEDEMRALWAKYA